MGHHHYKPRNFDFAQLLVTLRKRAGWTQEAVALRLGVAEKSIRNWEGGSNYPSEDHMRKLVELYLENQGFTSGHEQDEARALWEQLRASAPHRTSIFHEQWFATLLEGGRAHRSSRFLQGDWSEAFDVSAFYGRMDELAELERWLLADQCRLVAVMGMGGIGKTALIVKLAQQMTLHFDCILWCSLHNAPSLEELLLDWIPAISEQRDTCLPQGIDQSLALLTKLLRQRRCLLILDNLETLLQEGEQEGRYRDGYEAYAMLIRYVAESVHRSCLVLTCREQFPDVEVFSGRQAPVRVFRLGGLALSASQQILQDKGLFGDQEACSDLVQRYAGNPLALKIVAETVSDLFGGDIAAFLAEGFTAFHGIRQLLTQQFERLSVLEQELMYWLAIARELISLEALRADLRYPVSKSEVIAALHSLRSRSLVERGERGAVFTLQPVVLEYVTERLVILVSEEIREARPTLLLTHALLQAQAKDYLRTSQARLILQAVLDKLVSHFGSQERLEEQLDLLLQQLRALPRSKQAYGGGNVINLLVHLNGHMKGKNCSQLTIWQANLQGAEAQDANFVGADLAGSVFTEPIGDITCVALSANGQYLASGSATGELRLWRVSDAQLLLTLLGHVRQVRSLTFNPESTKLVSGGYDGLVKVWEVSSGQCVSTLTGHSTWVRSLAVHPAGKLLATCGDDGSIRLWDLTTGSCTKVWHEQDNGVWSVAFSPNGRLLASGDANGMVKLWDLAGEQCLWSIAAHRGSPTFSQHAVLCIAFSPDGEALVSGGQDAKIMVWETGSGEHLSTLSGHTDRVYSVTFNAEGLLASGSFDRTIKLWKIGQKGDASQLLGTLHGHTGVLWSVIFGPDGLLASGSQDGIIKLWQIDREGERGTCLRTLRGYTRLIHAVVFSPDGRLLVSSEQNGMLRVWEIKSGQCLRVLSKQAGGSSAAAFRPDGRLFAHTLPGNEIGIWDVASGQCLRTLRGHQGQVWSVIFSPDGRFLVSGGADMTIRLWEVSSGQCLTMFQGHGTWVWSLACSPDGQFVASGDVDGVVRVWKIGSGQCVSTLHDSPKAIVTLMFTPDGTRLLSSNAQDLVSMWDVNSGHCLKTILGIGDTYWLGSVVFSADGSLLAAGSSDQTIKLWDVSTGDLLRTFPCHVGRPWVVALSIDQQWLASGTDEGTIILWELQTGDCLMMLRGDRPYERMNISGATGITEAQKASLKNLGAIGEEDGTKH